MEGNLLTDCRHHIAHRIAMSSAVQKKRPPARAACAGSEEVMERPEGIEPTAYRYETVALSN